MELCDQSLRGLLDRGNMPYDKIMTISVQILKVMIELYSRKIAHLDLKPENILIVGDMYIKLIDFGCSI